MMEERSVFALLERVCGFCGRVLWTNPAPSASFPGQRISIANMLGYTHVEVDYKSTLTAKYMFTVKAPVTEGGIITLRNDFNFMSSSIGMARRVGTFTSAGISFGGCQIKPYTSSSAPVDDYAGTWLIPLQVRGIRVPHEK